MKLNPKSASSANDLLKQCFLAIFPAVKRLQQQRDKFAQALREQQDQSNELASTENLGSSPALSEVENRDAAQAQAVLLTTYLDSTPAVLQYREAYFEVTGHIAPGDGLPAAKAWPMADGGQSYEQKLLGSLPLATGRGVELGPLQIPITSRTTSNVLYVDHLDTAGLRAKYPTLENLVEIDRPIIDGNLGKTLQGDAPLDYFVASQVFEHVANPIRWLREIADVLAGGGLLSMSIPDRRTTFDLMRAESHPADLVAAFLENASIPNVRSVYEHHAQTTLVNMHWARGGAVTPEQVISGKGKVKAPKITDDHLAVVGLAQAGEYLDVHAWVFTPPSFLIAMAQLAIDGFLPFRLAQFYPTNFDISDRGSFSFTAILEKVGPEISFSELRRSFLQPLGN